MPLRVSDLLDPSRVVLDLRATRRTSAINEVARRLQGLPEIPNFSGFYTELLARERLDTTYIGNQVALPHARTDHASEIIMAAGRSAAGVVFENCNQTVRLMFVLATPKSRTQEYLLIVGTLCRVLKQAAVRRELMETSSAEEFREILAAAEARLVGVA